MTVRDIARQAMLVIGGPLQNGEVTSRVGLICANVLNMMLKSWQADGCNLWRLSDETVTVPANTKTVTLDPRVLDVMEARFVGGVTYQRELARLEWGDYRSLPNKDAVGFPTCYSLNKQRTDIELSLWPVANEIIEIAYSGARVIDDVTDDLDDNLDLPQEWMETAVYGLASRMIDTIDVATTSPATERRIQARADQLYQKLLDFDRTGSTFMKPWNYGAPYGQGQF
jgi:hypothetical protein